MCLIVVNPVKQVLKYISIIQKAGRQIFLSVFSDIFYRSIVLILIVYILNATLSIAGNQDDPAGGRSAGMSHTSVTLRDGWSCFNNQAGLGYLDKPMAGIYFENRYMVKEFSTKAAIFAYPFRPGTLSLNYRHFGYSKYNESKIGLAFGRKLAKRFAVGVQINYLQTRIAGDYENENSVAGELGILSEPVDNLFIGFHLFNPTQFKTENNLNQQLPTTARFGISYLLENKVLMAVETVKDQYSNPFFRIGLELEAVDKLYARLGFTTEINHYSIGLGYTFKGFTADFSFTNNRILGYTPQISVIGSL